MISVRLDHIGAGMTKTKVLYFTIATFAPAAQNNGGEMYTRNLVERLADDRGIELHVLQAADENVRGHATEWFKERDIPHLFKPLRSGIPFPKGNRAAEVGRFLWKTLFRYPHELESYGQPHIEEAGDWSIRHWSIEHVIFESLISALYWRTLLSRHFPATVVTINREVELFTQMLRQGDYPHTKFTGRVATARFRKAESDIYAAAKNVVAIGASDLPSTLPSSKSAVITPYLNEQSILWSRRPDDRSIFFVGNVGYHPNRLAVEHIIREIAPRLLALDRTISVKLIGCDHGQFPAVSISENVEMLGLSDRSTVENLFRSASLLFVPVENTFGMKFKVAEALSYGTPFLAASETMLGFPQLSKSSSVELCNPDATTKKIIYLLNTKGALEELSQSLLSQQRHFISCQCDIWSRTLFKREDDNGSLSDNPTAPQTSALKNTLPTLSR